MSRVFPYEPPRALAANLWQVKGSLAVPGVPRNMTVYRLPDGGLVLYSVVAMHDDGLRALEALGKPAVMVLPHDRHQMDAPFYKERYPSLRVLACAPDSRWNVRVDGGLDELALLGIHAYPLPGATYHEAIVELPIDEGIALCACELLGNVRGLRGPLGFLMKWVGPPGGGFGVARAVRWREVSDRAAVRSWLEGLARRTDIRMVLVGHGSPVTEGASLALSSAAAQA